MYMSQTDINTKKTKDFLIDMSFLLLSLNTQRIQKKKKEDINAESKCEILNESYFSQFNLSNIVKAILQ